MLIECLGMYAINIDENQDPFKRVEPPWDKLDAGIAATVRALWDAGFIPTDSGDGGKTDMECAIPVPHVFMICPPEILVSEAERLHRLVLEWIRAGRWTGELPSVNESAIQANYDPADGIGVIMLFHVQLDEHKMCAPTGAG